MAKVRKECLFVAFIYMEKAYDRVDIRQLFEVMRGYGNSGGCDREAIQWEYDEVCHVEYHDSMV